jgi:small-conductance mechanosensitive channel
VLVEHPAVINNPESLVLVESLGAATVNLRIYFWVDITKYSHLKVRSAVVRLTKHAFMQAGISMPDESQAAGKPGSRSGRRHQFIGGMTLSFTKIAMTLPSLPVANARASVRGLRRRHV